MTRLVSSGGNQVIASGQVAAAEAAATINPSDVSVMLGWLAGILDGEGCISINTRTRHREVVITNTDEAIIAKIQRAFDLLAIPWRTYRHVRRPKELGTKQRYDVRLSEKASYRLCRLLLPFLTGAKQAKAEALIAMGPLQTPLPDRRRWRRTKKRGRTRPDPRQQEL